MTAWLSKGADVVAERLKSPPSCPGVRTRRTRDIVHRWWCGVPLRLRLRHAQADACMSSDVCPDCLDFRAPSNTCLGVDQRWPRATGAVTYFLAKVLCGLWRNVWYTSLVRVDSVSPVTSGRSGRGVGRGGVFRDRAATETHILTLTMEESLSFLVSARWHSPCLCLVHVKCKAFNSFDFWAVAGLL